MNQNRQYSEYLNEMNNLTYSLKDRAIKSAGQMFTARMGGFMIQLVSTVILSRLLTPADFGIYAMVNSVTMLFLIFKDMGFTDATIQSESINDNQVNSLFWLNILSGLICAVIIISIAPAAATFYREPVLTPVFALSSLSFIISSFSLQHIALLKRRMQFSQVFKIELIGAFLSQLMAIVFALSGLRYWALVSRPITVALTSVTLSWVFCRWRPTTPGLHNEALPLVKFGINSIGYQLTSYFTRILDKVILGRVYGSETLGFYHRAYYVSALPVSKLSMSIFHVATSTLSKLQGDEEKYKAYYFKTVSLLSFVAMPLSMFMSFCSRELILLFLGPQWMGAVRIFSILSFALGFEILYTTNGWLHISQGRTDRWFRWGIISLASTVISLIIGSRFAVNGLAMAMSINMIVLTFPSILYAGKPIQMPMAPIFLITMKYFVSSLAAASSAWYFMTKLPEGNPVLRLLFFLAIMFINYNLALLITFRSFSAQREFLRILKKLKRGSK